MTIKKTLFILVLFIFPIFTPAYILILNPNEQISGKDISLFSDDGVDRDKINQSVTYEIDIDFTITSKNATPVDYWLQFVCLNDRQPENSLTEYVPPYQESERDDYSITGYNGEDNVTKNYHDEFDNTYHLVNATLGYGEEVSISETYEVKLNELYFKSIDDDDIGSYDTGSDIFTYYCRAEDFYEKDNAQLIALSNSIVDDDDNPVEKAEDIYDWVKDNIDYYIDESNSSEKGALWAYENKKGDCSEYATLMATLLRIQGIPARKVTGFLIDNDPTIKPEKGDEFDFSYEKEGSTASTDFLGHAWVEYYVPDIGWIQCDPTWGSEEGFDYFNRIDYLRFNLNIGANFLLHGSSPGNELYSSEFPFNTAIVSSKHNKYDYVYEVSIEVIDTDYVEADEEEDLILLIIIITSIIAAIVAGVVIILIIRKRKIKKREAEASDILEIYP